MAEHSLRIQSRHDQIAAVLRDAPQPLTTSQIDQELGWVMQSVSGGATMGWCGRCQTTHEGPVFYRLGATALLPSLKALEQRGLIERLPTYPMTWSLVLREHIELSEDWPIRESAPGDPPL